MQITAGTEGVTRLAAALRASAPAADKELRKQLRNAGALIGHQAERNADWSRKIPRTIRWTTDGTKVTVRAGYASVPIARWFENGRTEKSRVWKHPTIETVHRKRSKWKWVAERAPHRPYLAPALAEKKDEAVQMILQALATAIQSTLDDSQVG